MSGYRVRALTTSLWLLALLLNVGSAHAGGRVALVVGNGAYKFIPKLENPRGDARAIAKLLRSVGFDVLEGTDLTRDRMTELLLSFGAKAEGADLAIFYYAGQGVAVDRVNYLLPIDGDLKSVADIKLGAAVNIDVALDQTMAGAKTRLVFLDAPRTNPFDNVGDDKVGVRASLIGMKAPEDTLIAFAASPGQPASDGPKGGHSPFTQALLDNLAKPGVEIQEAMTMARTQVHERTNNQVLPWGITNLGGAIYLNPNVPTPVPAGGK